MENRTIIITGGAGFILMNLRDVEGRPNYMFEKMDICDCDAMESLIRTRNVDGIIHLAAESHVDRSIRDPFTFARTNVMGTLSLLQAARTVWESRPEGYSGKLFYHISTDEVYGALEMTRPEGVEYPWKGDGSGGGNRKAYGDTFFRETDKYSPHSPYSASKAKADTAYDKQHKAPQASSGLWKGGERA